MTEKVRRILFPGCARKACESAALCGLLGLLAVSVFPSSPRLVRAQADTSTGTICALTFNDLAKNGVHSAGDPVLIGVNVTLAVDNGLMIANHLSDDQGQYCFNNLIPGRYRLTFRDPLARPTTPTILTLTVNAGDQLVTMFGAITDSVANIAATAADKTQPGIVITLTRTGRLALAALGALTVMVTMFGLGLCGFGLLSILRPNRRRGGRPQPGAPAV